MNGAGLLTTSAEKGTRKRENTRDNRREREGESDRGAAALAGRLWRGGEGQRGTAREGEREREREISGEAK
jgi:hypothetical protein